MASFVYLNIPAFYKYEKSNIETKVCSGLNVKCKIRGKIKYSFFPSPRINVNNFIIKDFIEEDKELVQAKQVSIKISVYNLFNKEKIKYNNINLKNVIINLNLKNFEAYRSFFKKKFSTKPIYLSKGEINFFEGKKYISNIKNVNIKHTQDERTFKSIIKGTFLGDKIFISLENNKEKDYFLKTFVVKLFKLKKNRLVGTFDYKKNKIVFKNSNLQSTFFEGKLVGEIKFSPYFDFDLNAELNNINFNRIYNYLVVLDEIKKKNLFRINNKINGKLNLSVDKIISKKSIIKSFESRINFINGNIFIEQLLLNLGKLGAADIIGFTKNDKKYSNFKFESNIFIDNLKKFYNKFGIYNKGPNPYNLFLSGNVDLVNLFLRLDEISSNKKFKEEDVSYINKEFNEILLINGYQSLFSFANLKEFIRLITLENNN